MHGRRGPSGWLVWWPLWPCSSPPWRSPHPAWPGPGCHGTVVASAFSAPGCGCRWTGRDLMAPRSRCRWIAIWRTGREADWVAVREWGRRVGERRDWCGATARDWTALGRGGLTWSAGRCAVAPVLTRGALFCRPANAGEVLGRLSIPSTPAQARAYLPKTTAYARGCGRFSGALLNISRPPTTPATSTTCASSWATGDSPIGRVVRNLPRRDLRQHVSPSGAGDGARWSRRPADRGAGNGGALREHDRRDGRRVESVRVAVSACRISSLRACGPRSGGTPGGRIAARLRRSPIPAPNARPAGALSYGDLGPSCSPRSLLRPRGRSWPWTSDRRSPETARRWRRRRGPCSAARDPPSPIRRRRSSAPTVPHAKAPDAWPQVIAGLSQISRWAGPFVGWSNWAPCASWPARSAERYTGPWNRPTKIPLLLIGTTADPGLRTPTRAVSRGCSATRSC